MKKDLHPDYHAVTVVMTDGTEYVTRSCAGSAGDRINLDIDPRTHPAWTGGQQTLLDRGTGKSYRQVKMQEGTRNREWFAAQVCANVAQEKLVQTGTNFVEFNRKEEEFARRREEDRKM